MDEKKNGRRKMGEKDTGCQVLSSYTLAAPERSADICIVFFFDTEGFLQALHRSHNACITTCLAFAWTVASPRGLPETDRRVPGPVGRLCPGARHAVRHTYEVRVARQLIGSIYIYICILYMYIYIHYEYLVLADFLANIHFSKHLALGWLQMCAKLSHSMWERFAHQCSPHPVQASVHYPLDLGLTIS